MINWDEGGNYGDHPQSLAEIKSDKTGRATDWSPRDALIAMLRDIDAGKINPQKLVIVTAYVDEENNECHVEVSCAGTLSVWERRGILLGAMRVS